MDGGWWLVYSVKTRTAPAPTSKQSRAEPSVGAELVNSYKTALGFGFLNKKNVLTCPEGAVLLCVCGLSSHKLRRKFKVGS